VTSVSHLIVGCRDVFLQLLPPVREDEVFPTLDGEGNVNVDLRVGVGHGFMPLLRSLVGFRCWFL